MNDSEKPYFTRKQDLSVELGCLDYKYRIEIPNSLQKQILDEIHDGHLGMNKIKNLPRNFLNWPSIDRDIQDNFASVQRAAQCAMCRRMRRCTLGKFRCIHGNVYMKTSLIVGEHDI